MRREPTPAEHRLWQALRAGRLGQVRFYRQFVIGRYIVDFAARSAKLIVEVDGHTHGERVDHDARRTAWLAQQGYRVIRFTNADVMSNLAGVLDGILLALSAVPSPRPSPNGGGSR